MHRMVRWQNDALCLVFPTFKHLRSEQLAQAAFLKINMSKLTCLYHLNNQTSCCTHNAVSTKMLHTCQAFVWIFCGKFKVDPFLIKFTFSVLSICLWCLFWGWEKYLIPDPDNICHQDSVVTCCHFLSFFFPHGIL